MIINNEKCVLLSRKIKPVQNAYKGKEGVHFFQKAIKNDEDVIHIRYDNLDFRVNKLPIKPVYAEG